MNGLLFGPWLGTLYSMIGLISGSWLAMLLARRFGRPLVERYVEPTLISRLDGLVKKHGSVFVFLIFLTYHAMKQFRHFPRRLLLTRAESQALLVIAYPGATDILVKEALDHGLFDRFLFVDANFGPDVVLAVGCRFSAWLGIGRPPVMPGPPQQKIVHVDPPRSRGSRAR